MGREGRRRSLTLIPIWKKALGEEGEGVYSHNLKGKKKGREDSSHKLKERGVNKGE